MVRPRGRDTGSSEIRFQHALTRDNPGAVSDFYEVRWGSWLGKGAYGTVRRANCRRTGVERAIKSIEIKAVEDPKHLAAEIAVARRLHHPNVVRLFETFQEQKRIHLVMELCSGGELFTKISESPNGFREEKAVDYVRQIVGAVCYLHARQIVHRDLKPENFLLESSSPDAALKLADFGAARHFEPDGPPMKSQLGTAYYVAPEVLEGAYNELCDVWSVGVMTYVLLCGYAPFRGKTPGGILKRVKKGVVKFAGLEWEDKTQMAKDFVVELLSRSVEQRPAARQVLGKPWLQNDEPLADSPRLDEDILSRLCTFQQHAALKQVAVTAVAQHLPDAEVETWRSLFQALDKNGDGVLSLDEIREGLIKHGLTVSETLEETIRAADSDGSGCLDYTEFLAATIDQKLYTNKACCRAAFHSLDLNGDGIISEEEVGHLLSNENNTLARQSVVHRAMREVDLNGDGTIDFEEFFTMMKPQPKSNAAKLRPSLLMMPRISKAWAMPQRTLEQSKCWSQVWFSISRLTWCVCGTLPACGGGQHATSLAAAASLSSSSGGSGSSSKQAPRAKPTFKASAEQKQRSSTSAPAKRAGA